MGERNMHGQENEEKKIVLGTKVHTDIHSIFD